VTVLEEDALTQRRRLAAVKDRLARSPLVRGGGLLRARILDDAGLDALVQDAWQAHVGASEARLDLPGPGERGDPDRWLESAPGGPALERFAGSDALLELLTRATHVRWRPAGPGSWSYYRAEGHHLGIHRDLAVCDLAVITCVVDQGEGSDGGLLRLWPTRARETTAAIRRDPAGATQIRVQAGETVLLLGGLVAHQVLPLGPAQVRVVAPLCQQPAPGPGG
jgi:hypothetical protein